MVKTNKKIDTNKKLSAVSTGDNIDKGVTPACSNKLTSHILVYFVNNGKHGLPCLMNTKTWRKDMYKKVKSDIKHLEDLKLSVLKKPNDMTEKLIKMYDAAIENIKTSSIYRLQPVQIKNNDYSFKKEYICELAYIINKKGGHY